MAASKEIGCCKAIQNVYLKVNANASKIKVLCIQICDKNYATTNCSSCSRKLELNKIIDEIIKVQEELKEQVKVHEGKVRSTRFEDDVKTDPLVTFRWTEPCNFVSDSINVLLDIRRDTKILLAELEHHNDHDDSCENILTEQFKVDEIKNLTWNLYQALRELEKNIQQHCLSRHNAAAHQVDSGVSLGDRYSDRKSEELKLQRCGVYMQETDEEETLQKITNC